MGYIDKESIEIFRRKQWIKYNKYVLDKTEKYIEIPKKNNENINNIAYDPFEFSDEILFDLLMIGYKSTLLKINKKIEIDCLKFVSKYGFLGFYNFFIKDVCDNRNILIETKNGKLDIVSIKTYTDNFFEFKIFAMSDLSFTLEFVKKTVESIIPKDERFEVINAKDMVVSKLYSEPLGLIINFAKTLHDNYVFLSEMKSNPETTNKFYSCDLIDKGIDNIIPYISFSEKPVNVIKRWKYTSLASAIQIMFVEMVTSDKPAVKICKNCNKPFKPENPKTAYCSITCRNTANNRNSRINKRKSLKD